MSENWSDLEVALIVADYFSMLDAELQGSRINKTSYRHQLLPLLNFRSEGSIEFKHQNISAVLVSLGLPFIKGYKPRYNFQRSKLIRAVENYLIASPSIENCFKKFANSSVDIIKHVEFDNWIVDPPEKKTLLAEPIIPIRKPIKVNYLEKEQNNRDLGIQGEELVFKYEKHVLLQAGHLSLANKVEWISKNLGDGMGFDVLSKNFDGSDKYIEVKTTKLSKETPFFFTENELRFSAENVMSFYLYRLFDFNTEPKMFKVKGRYDTFCQVEPIQYKGYF